MVEKFACIKETILWLILIQLIRQAYESVLVISIADYVNKAGPIAGTVVADWKRLSRVEYNYTYKSDEQVT